MTTFDNIVLPAQCSCGEVVIYTSLGQLAAGPVNIECPTCGRTHRFDVGTDAERLRKALSDRFAGGPDTVACSMMAERD
jgi:4-hydroxy-3-methylbut-2-en-1-yl diphosphate synthase IspG/GcpE